MSAGDGPLRATLLNCTLKRSPNEARRAPLTASARP